MNLFNVGEVFMVVRDIEMGRTTLDASRMMLNATAIPSNAPGLNEEIEKGKFHTLDSITNAAEICVKANLPQAAVRLAEMQQRLSAPALVPMDLSTLTLEMGNAITEILRELVSRRFLVIDPERNYLLDDKNVMGDTVAVAFPSAVPDIIETGNCLAAECNTASLFHAMRVVEYGLRALAKDRRIKLPKKGQPIDLATWDDILKELEKAELAIQGYPRTHAREAQFEFYHGALMQFRRFKNVFRNRIMHAREDFGRTQALGVFENVRDFMQALVSRISETKHTPVIWKGPSWTK